MKTIYAFSGLGADKRVFERLDLSGFDVIHVDWIRPLHSDTIQSYALRLADVYRIPRQGSMVMGVSFGGMCISELSKFYDFSKTVLISSAKNKKELPNLYKLVPIGFQKLMPQDFFTRPNLVSNWLFGVSTIEERTLLADILKDTDPQFARWATQQIMNWDNEQVLSSCLHIHGDRDRIIPIHNVDYSIKIKGGGHMMVWNKAAELSFLIRNYLGV